MSNAGLRPEIAVEAPDGSCRGSPPARLGVGIAKPARFPSEETRSDSAFALLSLRSRNHAHSGFDGLPHPNPSPVPLGIKRSGRRGAPEPRHPSGALAIVIICYKMKHFRLMIILYRQIWDPTAHFNSEEDPFSSRNERRLRLAQAI